MPAEASMTVIGWGRKPRRRSNQWNREIYGLLFERDTSSVFGILGHRPGGRK